MMSMEVMEEAMEIGHVVKGKRTKRPRQSSLPAMVSSSSEERILESPAVAEVTTTSTGQFSDNTEEDEDLANCLILLAQSAGPDPLKAMAADRKGRFVSKRAPDLFECQTCSKCFPTFQALGGHRASHKKLRTDDDDNNKERSLTLDEEEGRVRLFKEGSTTMVVQQQGSGGVKREGKGKMHECGICGSEFTSGQALGGHMRRHRVVSEPPADPEKPKSIFTIDLNLPAPEDSDTADFIHFQPGSDFISQPPIVFATLVDCHH